jgi:hypothetical protein
MFYPGPMSRGKNPLVKAGTKKAVEDYFIDSYPNADIGATSPKTIVDFDSWCLITPPIGGLPLFQQSVSWWQQRKCFGISHLSGSLSELKKVIGLAAFNSDQSVDLFLRNST